MPQEHSVADDVEPKIAGQPKFGKDRVDSTLSGGFAASLEAELIDPAGALSPNPDWRGRQTSSTAKNMLRENGGVSGS